MSADELVLNPPSPPITPELDMVEFLVRHPDRTNWPDSYYQAAYRLADEQLEAARAAMATVEAEQERLRLVWQSLQRRALDALVNGDQHARDTVTAAMMTVSPWLAILPDLQKLASDRFRKLHQKQRELNSYQHARANAAARAQREAENLERLKAEQAEEHRQALASVGLTPEKAAQMDAARKAAHDARITAQQERRAKEAERLAALQAEAEAEAAALLNGGKATKK